MPKIVDASWTAAQFALLAYALAAWMQGDSPEERERKMVWAGKTLEVWCKKFLEDTSHA